MNFQAYHTMLKQKSVCKNLYFSQRSIFARTKEKETKNVKTTKKGSQGVAWEIYCHLLFDV